MDYIKPALKEIIGVEETEALYGIIGEDPLSIAQHTAYELQKLGVKKVIARKVVALFKFKHASYPKLKQILQSSDIYELMQPLATKDFEEFWILMLAQNNRVKKKEKVSRGGTAGTVVDVKIILKKAVLAKASAIILVHNHPSGNVNPSKADIEITKKIKEAGKYMDIQVLDHIIIAGHTYTSMADEGLM